MGKTQTRNVCVLIAVILGIATCAIFANSAYSATDDGEWRESTKLTISHGKVRDGLKGSKYVPLMYFGSIDKINTDSNKTILDYTVKDRPLLNNITSPNSAILSYSPNKVTNESNFLDNIDKGKGLRDGTELYTSSKGDGYGSDSKSEYGFVTSDIFDLFHPIGSPTPSISGTFKNNQSAMVNDDFLKYYIRNNSDTGLQEQKLTYAQYTMDKSKKKYRVEISIYRRFDDSPNSDKVITDVEYKSKYSPIPNFSGFVFNGVNFARNNVLLNTKFDPKNMGQVSTNSDDYNNQNYSRGVYWNFDINKGTGRYNVFLNDNASSPSSWSARSSVSTQNDFVDSKSFPWQKWEKSKRPTPYTDKSVYNNFKDLNDPGDNILITSATQEGKPFVENPQSQLDGLTMHTKPTTLETDQVQKLSYTSSLEIPELTNTFSIYLDQKGTIKNPDVINSVTQSYKLSGEWHCAKGEKPRFRALIDDKLDYSLNLGDKGFGNGSEGKSLRWDALLNTSQLGPGKHSLKLWLIDNNERLSNIEETTFEIPENIHPPTNPPTTPTDPNLSNHAPKMEIGFPTEKTSFGNPYIVEKGMKLTQLSGTWSDDTRQTPPLISYYFDKVPEGKKQNIAPGSLVNNKWVLNNVDLSKYLDDNNVHRIVFEAANDHGTTTRIFYFAKKMPELELLVPNIDFGNVNNLENGKIIDNPNIQNDLIVKHPSTIAGGEMKVNLTTTDFKKGGEKLSCCILWNNKDITNSDSYPVISKKSEELPIDGDLELTGELKKNLGLQVNPDNNRSGKYTSTFSWTLTNSI
jgi:hypothetical protein